MPAQADIEVEAAVLRLLLIEHQALLTTSEVERELGRQRDAISVDAIERAIDTLAGAGLVNRQGDLLLPSRVALYFDSLTIS
jgi:predicted transcriptional regulator